MTKKEQRQSLLLQIISAQGMLPIRTLATRLAVSEMTVRRDLAELELGHPSDGEEGGYSLLQELEKANAQKEQIGRAAAALIEPRDVIAIDTGSTTAKILPHIPTNYDLTVLCYNANVLFALRNRPGIRLLMCGGVYHPNTEMLESAEGVSFIRRIRVNKAFLSAAGIHQTLGVTCANPYEVAVKEAVLQSSSQKILVADSGKFGQVRSSHFCDLSQLDTIVTDTQLSPQWQADLEEAGVALRLA